MWNPTIAKMRKQVMENNNKDQRTPGMVCPRCGKFIPTSIAELLTAAYLRCPHCLLQLNIDRQQSARALSALAKVETARKRVEKSSRFNG